jgi:hypothetical protein
MKDEIVDLGFAKIKIPKPKEVQETKTILIGKCPFCKKEIRASTQSQFDWNMILHIRQKHKGEDEPQILKKQLEETNKFKK